MSLLHQEYTKACDPLSLLPSEIILRILDFASIGSVAACSLLSKAWYGFIDETHQNAIYSSPSKTYHQLGLRDPSKYGDNATSLMRYFDGIKSWKELCRRQFLLRQSWLQDRPAMTEVVIEKDNDVVWRFRPDFKRRFILSTSQRGGLYAACMDSHETLWSLDEDSVRTYAHLEYDEVGTRGVAVFDRWENALEVWRTVDDASCTTKGDAASQRRGVFELVAILHHDCETRGYQLSHNTLCVVSAEGQGFVYDMTGCSNPVASKPVLIKSISIEVGAIGHLDQDKECVMYSLGRKGYHIHSKASGAFLGAIEPWKCGDTNLYHIDHPVRATTEPSLPYLGSRRRSSLSISHEPSQDWSVPIHVKKGPQPENSKFGVNDRVAIGDDDWGAGMLRGNLMVGISRAGRVMIVKDWRACLAHADGNSSHTAAQALRTNSSLIQCRAADDSHLFDLGGWLSIHQNRILTEVRERIYVISLDENGELPTVEYNSPPSFAISKASAIELEVPVSFMGLYDDCLMHTYTAMSSLNLRQEATAIDQFFDWTPIKTIRALKVEPIGCGKRVNTRDQ